MSFFCCSNVSSFGHWEHFQLLFVSLWHIPINMQYIFLLLSTSLLSGTTKYFRSILYMSCLNPRISHFPNFHRRMVWETNIWVLGVLITTEVLFFIDTVSWHLKAWWVWYVYANPCICKYPQKVLYVTIYIFIKLNMSSCLQLSSITTWNILASSPSKLPSNDEKPPPTICPPFT